MIEYIGIILLSMLDISLTFYQIRIVKKKGIINEEKIEANPIARFIIKKIKWPFNLIVALIIFPFLWTVIFYFNEATKNSIYIPFCFGLIVMVNIYHYLNIVDYKKNWNNKEYWELCKKIQEAKIE